MPTSREMRLYLLPCTSSRSERTIVGTVAFEGMQPQYRCKYMGVQRIEFLIDLCIRIFKNSSILGSKWSQTVKIDQFDQNEPKIKRILKIRMHRSIRNLILRIVMCLHSWYADIPWNAIVPTTVHFLTKWTHDSRYSRIWRHAAHNIDVSTWVYRESNSWSIYAFGFSKKVLFWGQSGHKRSKLTSLTKTSPK